MRAILIAALLATSSVHASEYIDGPHWVVVIDACRDDNAHQCETFRKPFDAVSEISCLMNGWQAATLWATEHKGWHLMGQSCAKADERDI